MDDILTFIAIGGTVILMLCLAGYMTEVYGRCKHRK